jgi:hypothetical protein
MRSSSTCTACYLLKIGCSSDVSVKRKGGISPEFSGLCAHNSYQGARELNRMYGLRSGDGLGQLPAELSKPYAKLLRLHIIFLVLVWAYPAHNMHAWD